MTAAPDTRPSASRPTRRTALTFAVGAVALLAALAIVQTLAFTARSVNADNVVTFGSVKMQVLETTDDGTGREVDAPAEETLALQSGEASRIVRIRNTGAHPLYVRVALTVTGTSHSDAASPADDLVRYASGDAAWVERDGWRYFDRALAPGETTPPLITSLTVDTAAANARFPHGSLALHIDARGVQSEHNGTNPLDAAGWPEGGTS